MFDQLLSAKRQSGKTTWLVSRALNKSHNREKDTVIITIGYNHHASLLLRSKVEAALNNPATRVYTNYELEKELGKNHRQWQHVVILVDDFEVHRNSVAHKIAKAKAALTPAPDSTCDQLHPTFYVYGTHTIGEHV